MSVSAEDVRESVEANGISLIEHHHCALCGCMVYFVVKDKQLYFDSSCDCGRDELDPRPWSDAAEWINMQSDPRILAQVASRFGIEATP